ncbi:4-hydroxy-tetrahydrodipicolinate reductase [Alicyclobacillus tolerans]|uniref:4-hydroxy-tetrahydrodipicolinate reductase n=1 Tax=Alicyclobacillus tolerans TaxID=90970 RepID=UPI003B7BC24C
MTKPIRVVVAGAAGKMGQAALTAIQSDERLQLVGCLVRHTPKNLPIEKGREVVVGSQVQSLLKQTEPDVWLDLTDAESVKKHVDIAISEGVSPVVGATGYNMEQVEAWDQACREKDIGGLACPNFSVGALLMMRFAKEAARFFQHIEIVEYHHAGKKDAPSGTARRTAEMISDEALPSERIEPPLQSRGMMVAGIPIHSVRLPGLVAHQEVLCGGVGELLTIRHDSLSRDSFMPGILEACVAVKELKGMVYGLEHVLF